MTNQDDMDKLHKKKQSVDINRVYCGLIPHSGIHYIFPKTGEQKRLDFERGTFKEIGED